MNKKTKIYASAFLILLLAAVLLPNSISGNEKTEIPKFSTTVQLSIAAPYEIKNLVHSYLSRELRSLGDIKLVENDPEWIIDIIACQVKDRTGYVGGVMFSVVIEKRYRMPVELLMSTVRSAFRITSDDWNKLKETRQYLEEAFTEIDTACNFKDLVHHKLRTGNSRDMQSICQEIVADFDAEHLNKQRETFLRIQGKMSKYN